MRRGNQYGYENLRKPTVFRGGLQKVKIIISSFKSKVGRRLTCLNSESNNSFCWNKEWFGAPKSGDFITIRNIHSILSHTHVKIRHHIHDEPIFTYHLE